MRPANIYLVFLGTDINSESFRVKKQMMTSVARGFASVIERIDQVYVWW
jgi:hypothetical protein